MRIVNPNDEVVTEVADADISKDREACDSFLEEDGLGQFALMRCSAAGVPPLRSEGFLDLFEPPRVWSRAEVLSSPCPVPREPGVYAWYFKEAPPGVPITDCVRSGDLTLLYVGIAPRALPMNGKPASSQRLRHRVRYHYRGNAEGSTLRLTLGCLLANRLGIELRRIGSGNRLTFAGGESVLSSWMHDNAFVAWHVDVEPWTLERQILGGVALPLNLDMNRGHAFHPVLSQLRREAKEGARRLPVVD